MKKCSVLWLSLLIFGAFSFLAPKNELIQKIKANLRIWLEDYPQEKVYLQTDKPFYAPREDIWFKVYLLNASYHLPQKLSTVVYVDLVGPDETIIETLNVKIEEGSGEGDFQLEEDAIEGTYQLRAYTTYMRNYGSDWFFRKPIYVYHFGNNETNQSAVGKASKKSKNNPNELETKPAIDVQFFPEGGDLIENMTSRVAVKSVNSSGQSIQVVGSILDQNGQIAANFRTFTHGLGLFNFKPKSGYSYSANIEHYEDLSLSFPEALESGFTLQIKQTKDDSIQIKAKASPAMTFEGMSIVGHLRGEIFCVIEGHSSQQGLLAKIPKGELPDGLAHFTLFDFNGRPHCERMIFIENKENQSTTSLNFQKAHYSNREKVQLEIHTQKQDGSPVQADCLIAITDRQQVVRSEDEENIRSWFLLNSELKGTIENPGYYFADDDPKRKRVLDLLMMTQGWSRFTWKDIVEDRFPSINYTVETGFMFSGKLTRYDNPNKPVKGKVFCSVLGDNFMMQEFETQENGLFVFGGYHFEDTTNMLFQGRIPPKDGNEKKPKKDDLRKGKKHLSIYLDDLGSPDFSKIQPPFHFVKDEALVAEFREERYKIGVVESNYDMKMVALGEVLITARRSRKKDPFYRPYQAHRQQSQRIVIDSIAGGATYGNMLNLLQAYVPTIKILGTYPDQEIRLRSAISGGTIPGAGILLDGMVTPLNFVLNLPTDDIHYIDVLNNIEATVYGADGAGGIIAIYTKSGAGIPTNRPNPGRLNLLHNGYYAARQFYSPKYDVSKASDERPDFRTTLFWKPKITTDENGKATVEFYTCDNTTTYEVLVEGMTYEGIPIRTKSQFRVD